MSLGGSASLPPSRKSIASKRRVFIFMNTPTEEKQEDMYGMAEMPDLIPPAVALQPSPVIPYDHREAGRNRPDLLSAPRRMQRAPKLGEIGRSTRVVIDDEDLDDIINNNRNFPGSRRV